MKPTTVMMSVRLDQRHWLQIEGERIRGDCDRSTAAKRLWDRAAGLPTPIYLKSQISCEDELQEFSKLLTGLLPLSNWARRLMPLQSPIPEADHAKLISECQDSLKELTAVARLTLQKMQHLAQLMSGLSAEQYFALVKVRFLLESCQQEIQADLSNTALSQEERADLEVALDAFKNELYLFNILGIT